MAFRLRLDVLAARSPVHRLLRHRIAEDGWRMNERSFYYIGIAFFGMINGIFNPFFVIVFQVSIYLMAEPLFGSTAAIAYFSSLMLSTATVILGGIPAALYERYIGAKDDSTIASLWIWLAGTAILTIPAIGNFLKIGL
jgi:hypothetical protein